MTGLLRFTRNDKGGGETNRFWIVYMLSFSVALMGVFGVSLGYEKNIFDFVCVCVGRLYVPGKTSWICVPGRSG